MNREQGIMELIYNKINEVIGAGNQLFCMQMPAQPLNYRMYQYDTSDRYSVLTRPYTVAEQEFRLSDQLFDVSPVTAGSNGEKLSIVYETLINNFIPKIDYLVPFIKDRAGLGGFLLEESGEKDKNGKSLSRIELCKNLYEEYLNAKNNWNEEKNKKFDDCKKEENGLDKYAQWLSSDAMVEEEKLNNLYNEVVVRGHLHEVLTILGYLNASSIAEELEVSKQRMRNSARISLDESMTVYPVQFQPNNWFKALSPNLNPEDLTMAKDSIRDQYIAKQRELSRAKTELQKMQLLDVDPMEVDSLKKEIATSQKNINDAELDLIKKYGDGAVGVAKLCVKVMGTVETGGAFDVIKAKQLGASDDMIKEVENAVKGISETYTAQQNLTSDLSKLTALQARQAQLASHDWKFNKASLEQRVSELQAEVDYYGDLLANVIQEAARTTRIELERQSFADGKLSYQIGVSPAVAGGTFKLQIGDKTKIANVTIPDRATTGDKFFENVKNTIETEAKKLYPNLTVTSLKDPDGKEFGGYWLLTIPGLTDEVDIVAIEDGLLPPVVKKEPGLLPTRMTEEEAEVSNMFQDIVFKITESTSQEEQTEASKASTLRWGLSTWFGSAGGESESMEASASQRSNFFNQEMEIGFRVAKVSFDRGGWFNPQIFKMSHAFSRLADLRVSGGKTINDVFTTNGSTQAKPKEDLKNLFMYDSDQKDGDGKPVKTPYVLPAFPVAMAIAKDVTIRVKSSKENSENAKSVIAKSSAAGGGFLCFSVSGSSSSKSSSESAMHGAYGDYYYIRIPGPQVIGYFMQFVADDKSVPYKALLNASGESPVVEAFEVFDNPHHAPRVIPPAPPITS